MIEVPTRMAKNAKASNKPARQALMLRLYVAAGAPNSAAAEANLRRCAGPLGVPFEIINVLVDKVRALADGIMVTPTLIRHGAGPQEVMIGNLDDPDALKRFVDR